MPILRRTYQRLYIFLLSGSLFLTCQGQSSDLPDTAQVDRFTAISARFLLQSQKDSAQWYAGLAEQSAQSIHYIHGLAEALSIKSQIAKHFDDDLVLSESLGREALGYFERTENKQGLDTLYYRLFQVAAAQSKFEEAADVMERYYALAVRSNNQDEIYSSLDAMFSLNLAMGNYDKGFFYGQKLYDIAASEGNKYWLAGSLWNLAQLYQRIEDYPNALEYYRKARDRSDGDVRAVRLRQDQELSFEIGFAEVFSRLNQFDSAWYYYQLYKPSNQAFNRLYWISLGEYYFLQGKFPLALQQYKIGLNANIDHHDVNGIMRSLLDMANVYLVLDSSSHALAYGRQGLAIALQTRVDQNIRDGYKILSDAYAKLDRMDSSDLYFRKYVIVKDAVLDDQAKGKFSAYRYQQQIALMDKEKQIQALRLQKETWVKWILAASLLLIILFVLLLFRYIKLKRDREKAELLQQRSELEMKALRAQMDPHFIFNCLNSINRFIIRHDAVRAADYLTKFSRLIRMVLERSGKHLISLEDELCCLQLYMDLEAIRFEKPFTYTIHHTGIDKEAVMLPPMLIQPFVENAIWHGLHDFEDGYGKITLTFTMEEDILYCEIADNGIGLAASAALNEKKSLQKRSLGIELTRQRLRLANMQDHNGTDVTIREVKDREGENSGTCVQIRVPVQYL